LQIATHLAEIFERQAESKVGDEADDSRDAVTFGDLSDAIFTGLHHLVPKGEFEFVREGFRQPPVNRPRDLHKVTFPSALRALT
jgi:hypothetical protein